MKNNLFVGTLIVFSSTGVFYLLKNTLDLEALSNTSTIIANLVIILGAFGLWEWMKRRNNRA